MFAALAEALLADFEASLEPLLSKYPPTSDIAGTADIAPSHTIPLSLIFQRLADLHRWSDDFIFYLK